MTLSEEQLLEQPCAKCKCGGALYKGDVFCAECGEKVPYCEKCGFILPADSKFCYNCGFSAQKVCSSCGKELPDNLPSSVRFCPSCGASLTAAAAPAAQPSSNVPAPAPAEPAPAPAPAYVGAAPAHAEPATVAALATVAASACSAPVPKPNAAPVVNVTAVPRAEEQLDLIGLLKCSSKQMKWYEWFMAAILIILAVQLAIESSFGYRELLILLSKICASVYIFFNAKAHLAFLPLAIVGVIFESAYIISLSDLFLDFFPWRWLFWAVIYLPVYAIGWMLWKKHIDEQAKERVKVRRLSLIQNVATAIFIMAGASLYYGYLIIADVKYIFNICDTAPVISFAAAVLLVLRYREHYIWWLIGFILSFVENIGNDYFNTLNAIENLIMISVAVIGLVNWVKLSKMNVNNE